ncbi:MAG: signal peptidase II [Dehalococcoides mccartyi]|uniref:Lipoprotein signal peptidase n=1 Tax=Dehalococcoides mccartyi TaxID=61435 RepID=A0AB38Z956_9CHLR|nr:signal peptidase II [Dehalococcoides mccartyi]MDN4186515.1 signal peptidase II [Dehalococcoides mccartyi]OBW61450.1 MAG: signal peptidase II [Dehalococcoides mccartyi]POZ59786.1 Lipoprotein signal peptidase [Dehalococcoides mccartyi]WRO07042.1 signal peptidase II [Dehalococcoides mccartyi]
MTRGLVFFVSAACGVLADQLSKFIIAANLTPGTAIPESGFFQIVHVHNTGAAFSIFRGHTEWLIAASCLGVILALTAFFLRKKLPFLDTRPGLAALGIILAGTIGNLIDRVRLGYVTDFIQVGSFPTFNMADSCLTLGIIWLVLLYLTSSHSGGDASENA